MQTVNRCPNKSNAAFSHQRGLPHCDMITVPPFSSACCTKEGIVIGKLSPAAGPAVQERSSTNEKSIFPRNGLIANRSSLNGAHGFGSPLKPCLNLLSPLQFAQGLDRLDRLRWGVQTAETAYIGETLAGKPLEPACRSATHCYQSRRNSASVIGRQ